MNRIRGLCVRVNLSFAMEHFSFFIFFVPLDLIYMLVYLYH